MKVDRVKLHNLRNAEYVQFFVRFRDLVRESEPARLRIEPQYTAFLALYDTLDEAYRKILRSALTETINNLDRERDEVFRGMKDAVRSAHRHFSPTVKEAARRVQIVVDAYGDPTQTGKSEETAALNDMMRSMLTTHQAAVEMLDLMPWIKELDRLNVAVEDLMRDRFDETTARTDAAMREVRLLVDTSYYDIVARVEALQLIEGAAPDTPWAPFIESLNTIIDYTNSIVAQRKGKSAAKRREEEAAQPAPDAPADSGTR